jgi:hypothetical protein
MGDINIFIFFNLAESTGCLLRLSVRSYIRNTHYTINLNINVKGSFEALSARFNVDRICIYLQVFSQTTDNNKDGKKI